MNRSKESRQRWEEGHPSPVLMELVEASKDIRHYFSPYFRGLNLQETASKREDGKVHFFLPVLMERQDQREAAG